MVRRAILLPLCRRDGQGSPVCLPSNEPSMHPPTHLLIHRKPRILTTCFLPNDPTTHWAKDGCLPSVHPSNEPSTHPLVPGAIQLGVCLLTCAHLPTSRPQPLRTRGLRGAGGKDGTDTPSPTESGWARGKVRRRGTQGAGRASWRSGSEAEGTGHAGPNAEWYGWTGRTTQNRELRPRGGDGGHRSSPEGGQCWEIQGP